MDRPVLVRNLPLAHHYLLVCVLVVPGDAHPIAKVSVCAVLSIVCPVILYHAVEKPMIAKGVKLANWLATPNSRDNRVSHIETADA